LAQAALCTPALAVLLYLETSLQLAAVLELTILVMQADLVVALVKAAAQAQARLELQVKVMQAAVKLAALEAEAVQVQ
jgi:hypothetical protein